MSTAMRAMLLLVAISFIFPSSAQTQLFSDPSNTRCRGCQPSQPCCPLVHKYGHPQPAFQQHRISNPVFNAPSSPAINTHFRQQKIVTYHDVPSVEYRRKIQIDIVPATMFRDVLVDQGSYQTVWVPKLVTQRTKQTVYQQRLSYRTVPYQVNRRIPQLSTRLVQQPALPYIPRTDYAHTRPTAPLTIRPLPNYTPTATTTMPSLIVPSLRTAQKSSKSKIVPIPDPKFMEPPLADHYDERTTVKAQDNAAHFDSHIRNDLITDPFENSIPPKPVSGRNSQFVPAPSAAIVWQTRRQLLRK